MERRIEGSLLFFMLFILPFQNEIEILPGFSLVWGIFGLVGLYCLFVIPDRLNKNLFHPLLLIFYPLVAWAFLIETFSDHRSYSECFQILQMLVGAGLITTLMSAGHHQRVALYGLIAGGVYLSALLLSQAYQVLLGASVANAYGASAVRVEVFRDLQMNANLNEMAFYLAISSMSCLVLALDKASAWQARLLAYLCLVFCALGALMPMSRGGAIVLIVSLLAVVRGYRKSFGGIVVVGGVLVGIIALLIPQVVLTRLTATNTEYQGKEDSRMVLVQNFFNEFSEFWWRGVGTNNYWEAWGHQHGFVFKEGFTVGTHNALFQAWVYWGFVGAILFVGSYFIFLKSIAFLERGTLEASFVKSLSVSLVVLLAVTHILFAKEISIILGLGIGLMETVKRTESAIA